MENKKLTNKICKNCKYREPYHDALNKVNIGTCIKEGLDGFKMQDNEFSVMCGHDGPVFVGPYFGCIHFHNF